MQSQLLIEKPEPRVIVTREFLMEETSVRESGEGPVFDTSVFEGRPAVLTLGITHAIEQESLELDLLGSDDGKNWTARPIVSFTAKSWCGTYQAVLPGPGPGPGPAVRRYLRPVWRVTRWSRSGSTPFFRFYLCGEPLRRAVSRAGAA